MSKRHCEIDIVERKGAVGQFLSGLSATISFLLFFFTSLSSVYFQMPWLLLVYLYQPLQRKLCELFIAIWFELSTTILYFLGSRVVITGDAEIFPRRSFVIMNHRTMLDWMYYWCLTDKLACHLSTKIVLKNELKMVPGFGWAMQLCTYIFLKRSWDQDKRYVDDMLSYFKLSREPYQLLIFPEGTNLHPLTVPKSNKFAKANNLPEYEYSLHPRSTGFLYFLDKLCPCSSTDTSEEVYLDSLIDVTLGFKGNIPLNQWIFFKGYLPKEIHFHLKQYKLSEIPSSEEGRERWLREVWREKEARLKRFYEGDHSFGPEARHLPEKSWLRRSLVILFWSSPFLITYLLWSVCPRWALACYLLIPLFYFLQYKYDGVERFIASNFLYNFNKKYK